MKFKPIYLIWAPAVLFMVMLGVLLAVVGATRLQMLDPDFHFYMHSPQGGGGNGGEVMLVEHPMTATLEDMRVAPTMPKEHPNVTTIEIGKNKPTQLIMAWVWGDGENPDSALLITWRW